MVKSRNLGLVMNSKTIKETTRSINSPLVRWIREVEQATGRLCNEQSSFYTRPSSKKLHVLQQQKVERPPTSIPRLGKLETAEWKADLVSEAKLLSLPQGRIRSSHASTSNQFYSRREDVIVALLTHFHTLTVLHVLREGDENRFLVGVNDRIF